MYSGMLAQPRVRSYTLNQPSKAGWTFQFFPRYHQPIDNQCTDKMNFFPSICTRQSHGEILYLYTKKTAGKILQCTNNMNI